MKSIPSPRGAFLFVLSSVLCAASLGPALRAQDGAKPAQAGGAAAHLGVVHARLAEVQKFLKEPKAEAPSAAVLQMQRKALEALQAEPKKELRELMLGTLDLEIAIDKKDWPEAGKIADVLGKALPAGSKAQDAAATGSENGKAKDLDAHMKAINSSLKTVNRYLKTPTGTAPVAQVYDMQRHALEAKGIPPKSAAKKPAGDEHVKFVCGYKKEMREMMGGLIDLGFALDKKDTAAAGKVIEKLNKLKSDSHKVYRVKGEEEEDDGGDEGAKKGDGK